MRNEHPQHKGGPKLHRDRPKRSFASIITIAAAIWIGYGTGVLALEQEANAIYTGGDIITMNDLQPSAEAIAVKDGKILAVGAEDEVLKHKGTATKMVDLGGKTLLPGFIDAHGHVFNTELQALAANLLSDDEAAALVDKAFSKGWQILTGFRYLIVRKFGLHSGVDVARGPEDTYLYIQIGSAW